MNIPAQRVRTKHPQEPPDGAARVQTQRKESEVVLALTPGAALGRGRSPPTLYLATSSFTCKANRELREDVLYALL